MNWMFVENAQFPTERIQSSKGVFLEKQHLTREAIQRDAVVYSALPPCPILVSSDVLRLHTTADRIVSS